MEARGIPHGVMLDDDNGKEHQWAVNDLVEATANDHTLAASMIHWLFGNVLGLQVPTKGKKLLEVFKAVTNGQIANDKLQALRAEFCKVLAI